MWAAKFHHRGFCGIHFDDGEIIIKNRIWPSFIRSVQPLSGHAKVGSFPSILAAHRTVGHQRCSVDHGVLGSKLND